LKVVFTARRVHPGQFDGFRSAWEPERFPDGFERAYVLRDPGDPDVVVACGMFDVTDERAGRLKAELEPSERARHAAMAPFVAETLVTGLFDVVHSVEGAGSGRHTIVPLTERRLKPGSLADYRAAMRRATTESGGPPRETVRIVAMADTADREHLIQFGIFRSDEPGAMRARGRGGRERMLAAIAPYVQSVGLDRTFEMVEELAPAHA
jgi:hypothetical protein